MVLLIIRLWLAFAVGGPIACAQILTELPFEYREGLIWLRVTASQSAEPLNFLLDSGAGVSVIDLRTAKKLGIKLGEKVSVQGVSVKTSGYWPQHLAAAVAETPLPDTYLALDLIKLSQSCACRVDGLIGADFFRMRIVQIDYSAQRIRLLKSTLPYIDQPSLPLKVKRHCLLTQVSVAGSQPKWVRLDTGCVSSLQWIQPGNHVVKGVERQKISVGLDEVVYSTGDLTVDLGAHSFKNIPVGLHQNEIFPGESGLLGNGLLSRFVVTIDVPGKRIFFF